MNASRSAADRPAAGIPAGGAAVAGLSRDFKDSFKLALSVVLAIGIALKLGWERPYWAALAVMLCSFTASGDSLNKGLLRLFGTLMALVVTLTLVGVAAQDRWLYLGLITAWILFCSYVQSGGSRGYCWTYAGFTVPILALDGGVQSAVSFQTVILRAQETTLGVLVFSLVSFLLWPVSSRGPFERAVGQVVEAERQVTEYLLRLMAGQPEDGTADNVSARVAPLLARLPAMLDGAELDSFEIRRNRRVWRRIIGNLREIREAMQRWHSSLADVRDLELKQLLPDQEAFGAEIARRLEAVRNMLQGVAPAFEPAPAEPGLDRDRLNTLPLFDRAALVSCTDQMKRVDRLTASVFTNMAAALGFRDDPEPVAAATVPAPASAPLFDPDRFLSASRVFFAVWMAILLVIYVPALPGPVIFITVGTAIAINLALMPHLSPLIAQGPAVRAVLFAGAVYLFVMPHLSSFAELAIVLFVAVFGIAYRIPMAKAPIARPLALSQLAVGISLHNQQTYSFLYTANLLLPIVLVIWLITASGYVPVSFQAKDRFLHLFRRFFSSCSFLVSDSQWGPQLAPSRLMRARERFHASEVDGIPSKMLPFCGGIQARIGAGTRPSPQALVATLQSLRRRILEVHRARAEIAPFSERLPEALREELGTWRSVLSDLFERLAADPQALEGADLAGRLDAKVRHLEASVETALNDSFSGALESADALKLYRLLAALRDISVSLVAFEDQAEAFRWDRLRESRF